VGQTVRAEGVPIGTTVAAIVGSSQTITLSAATTAALPKPTELIFTSTTCSDGTTSAVAACWNGWYKTGAYVAGVSSEACTACTAITNAQTTYCAGATATQALLCNTGYYISGTYSSPTASDTCEVRSVSGAAHLDQHAIWLTLSTDSGLVSGSLLRDRSESAP